MEVTRSYRFPSFDAFDANDAFGGAARFRYRKNSWRPSPIGRTPTARPMQAAGEASHAGSNAREPCSARGHSVP